MSLRVPIIPPVIMRQRTSGPLTNPARIAAPVTAQDEWYRLAQAENWLLGTGATLAWWGPGVLLGDSDTHTFRSYCWPRPGHFARLWTFCVKGPGAAFAVATADHPTGVFCTVDASATGTTVVTVAELVDEVDPTGEEISVQVVNSDFGPNLYIMSVHCAELPLKKVGLAEDNWGVHQNSCWKDHPIIQRDEFVPATAELYSVSGVAYAAEILKEGANALRRLKSFDWHLTSGVTNATATYANVMLLNPTVQSRLKGGEAVNDHAIAVYATSSSGNGWVRVTSSITGAIVAIPITGTSPAWYFSAIDVAVDDMDEDAWINGGTRRTLQFDHRATSGSVTTYGIAMGEAP